MPLKDETYPSDEYRFQSPEPAHDTARALDEITSILHRMLALAELSASDLKLDRDLLQKTLDRLKNEIDRIADTL